MPGSKPPKPPGQRRRRNLGQSQWRQLPASGREDKAPLLPEGEWLDSTHEWWRTLWSSPMAITYQPADEDALHRLARLRDASVRSVSSASELGEMRQLEDRFGLSPMARRKLQWEITQAEQVRDQPAEVRRLRAVDASA